MPGITQCSNAVAAAEIDLSDDAFWQQPSAERDAAFGVLRRERPVSWHRAPEPRLLPPERVWQTGYWAIVRHADVRAVSRDPTTFRSGDGVMFDGKILDESESLISMDGPLHSKLRAVIRELFSPRHVADVEHRIQERAYEIIGALDARDEFDLDEELAAPLPMMTLLDILAVPDGERERVAALVKALVDWNHRAAVDEDPFGSLRAYVAQLTGFARELAAHRMRHPSNDVISRLVHADVDGRRLRSDEIVDFVLLLCMAGTDTTRRTISQAARALAAYPSQRQLLLDDLPGRIDTAVEEFVRWTSPLTAFCRTATRATELGGQPISRGDRVALFYRSANFDESAFTSPEQLNVVRAPNNPHVGFGGGGPHHCLGAAFARAQVRAIIIALLTRVPRFEVSEGRVQQLL